MPLERDEGEYAYIGSLLLDGVPPYAGAYTMKLPGTPVMYALAMAMFGRTAAAIRIGLLLVTIATAILLFLLARRLLGTIAASAAVTVFACLSIAPALLGTHAHATHFVSLAATAGLLTLASALDTGRPMRVFAAGMLFGAAILMKQAGVVFTAFAFCWIAWCSWQTLRRPWHRFTARVLPFVAGVSAPLAATAGALWTAGTLDACWFWTVTYAQQYATSTSLAMGVERLWLRLAAMAPSLSGFGVLVLAATAALIAPRARTRGRAYIAGLFVFSIVGVCAGLYFRPHYFLLLAPAASLLVGFAVEEARAVGASIKLATSLVIAALIVFAAGQSLWAQREVLFTATPTEVSRTLYYASPFPEAVEVARYLQEHTVPTDTIAILGSEPEILFYARRRSATRHIYMYSLMEAQPFARTMQSQMISEIERARPRYVVYVRTESSWDRTVLSERLVFNWMAGFLPAYYTPVGKVDILGPHATRFVWDADVADTTVTPYTHLVVLRRT